MHYKHFAAGLLLCSGTFLSCKKNKADFFNDNRPSTEVTNSSLVRLVNINGSGQLVVNGDTLTTWKFNMPVVGGNTPAVDGTKWFPETGSLGTTYSIPRQLLQNGKAFIYTNIFGYQLAPDSIGFNVEEKANMPMDYYMLKGDIATATLQPRIMEVPRQTTAPSRPGYFKIRLLNIADRLKPQGDPVFEDLSKPLTLAYADGTPVSTQTTSVGVRQYSEYVEVPYGTYQFKVLTPEGTEVAAQGGTTFESTNVQDQSTSTLVTATTGIPHTVSTGLTYAPVRSFKPGGVYTIVVATHTVRVPYYPADFAGENVPGFQNVFRVIADISEPENANYFRVQGVHALPGEGAVTFRVNGNKLGDLAYSAHTDYSIFVQGSTTIDALNAQGSVLASVSVDAAANLNYTAWLYKQPDGKAAIALVNNNLSGGMYFVGTGTDGQDGQYLQVKQHYPFAKRFLNLCADLPYASFTLANGASMGASASNLAPGEIALHLPYHRSAQGADDYQIMVYRSSPGVFPGNWITQIPVLKNTDFIAKPEHYIRPVKPKQEPGVYTVALIGELAGTGAQQAKMIIVKHTK
ncbi:DUF4397 domain-containing protein [Chitinophaga horti]|uniref:DUF4397 domain-containing protein n=1 Tax=Chitinophaga horti TaxID=2920382 RepID=A0ABY6J7I1_9BACT|nr:DUF4397 domain-containing protein [Chitinophaga horti]UYQ95645.1 DUF4397 domain-containing protein [Chitinophaga horti]